MSVVVNPIPIAVNSGTTNESDEMLHHFIVSSQSEETPLDNSLGAADMELTKEDIKMQMNDVSDKELTLQIGGQAAIVEW